MIDVFQELEKDLRLISVRADLHYRSLEQLRQEAIRKAEAVCGDSAEVADIASETTDVEDVSIPLVIERLRFAALDLIA